MVHVFNFCNILTRIRTIRHSFCYKIYSMAKKRRESDLSADLQLSVYGNSRKLEPENIKAYVLYKKLSESSNILDNFVLASSDLNEISVTLKKQSYYKVFSFDKVLCNDSTQDEKFEYLTKFYVQDLISGLHSFVIIYQLSMSSTATYFKETSYADSSNCFVENILKELLIYISQKDNTDTSLHVSYFEVHDDKIIDLLKICKEPNDLEINETPDQTISDIKDLTEKPLLDYKDISDFLSKCQFNDVMSYGISYCSVICVSLIKKNVHCRGFEYIKVGKLTMVDFSKCNVSSELNKNFHDWLLTFTENNEFSYSPRYKILDILRPAFGGIARTSILVYASTALYSFEEDLKKLQIASEARKILNFPEIDLKLVVPNALKEYSEEIHELQKDLNAIVKGSGLLLDVHMYRFYKNSISLENEKIKSLNNILEKKTNKVNSQQSLINLRATSKAVELDIEQNKIKLEDLKEFKKKENEEKHIKQILSRKIDEILALKQKITQEVITNIKLEILKAIKIDEELTSNLCCLKAKIVSLSCSKGAEQTTLRSTLELLMVDMNTTLRKFQSLQQDLLKKLDNVIEIDVLQQTWQQITEVILCKFSAFILENEKKLDSIQPANSYSVSLHTVQSEILEVIQKNQNERWSILQYYLKKEQIFCDSSFKTLTEVTYHLDAIQNCYRAELNTIDGILSSSSRSYENFLTLMGIALKSYEQLLQEQKNSLSELTEKPYFHHEFKKQFDENIGEIKNHIFALKQMCLNHNSATISTWNQIQKDYHKATENNMCLSDNLYKIHKAMKESVDNLSEQKMNALDKSLIKEKTKNVEGKISQLVQMQKDMTIVFEEAYEEHNKETNKEQIEVEKSLNSRKEEIEIYFDTLSTKLKASSKTFFDGLRNIKKCMNSKDELKENLNSFSSTFALRAVYDKYLSISSFILDKTIRSFKIMPTVSEDKSDNISDVDNLIFDEYKVSTSTPKNPENKILNLSYEREKLSNRLKSVIEQQQVSNKLSVFDLDTEKEIRNDVSTVSLPNISTFSKVYKRKKK